MCGPNTLASSQCSFFCFLTDMVSAGIKKLLSDPELQRDASESRGSDPSTSPHPYTQ